MEHLKKYEVINEFFRWTKNRWMNMILISEFNQTNWNNEEAAVFVSICSGKNAMNIMTMFVVIIAVEFSSLSSVIILWGNKAMSQIKIFISNGKVL